MAKTKSARHDRAIERLREFYQTELLRDLQRFEDIRRREVWKAVWNRLGGSFAIGLGLFIWGLLSLVLLISGLHELFVSGFNDTLIMGLVLSGIWLLIALGLVGSIDLTKTSIQAELKTMAYKETIIKRIIQFASKDLVYNPRRGLSDTFLEYSGLFPSYPSFRTEDMVTGKLGNTQFIFCEVLRDRSTEEEDLWTPHSLLVMADFHKQFKGQTILFPDRDERFLGRLGSQLQALSTRHGRLVKLEDPEFEKEFVVYASDQIEARYILTPSMMQRIVQFKRKTGKAIQLSFVGSMVFVAIPQKKDLFEIRPFRRLTRFEQIQEYFEDLLLPLTLVRYLNLNTRIWSKR